jgi:hypothetical protein
MNRDETSPDDESALLGELDDRPLLEQVAGGADPVQLLDEAVAHIAGLRDGLRLLVFCRAVQKGLAA